MIKLVPETFYDEEKIRLHFPKLILLKTATSETGWEVELYYDPGADLFFEKGYFGRGDILGFYFLDIRNEVEWEAGRINKNLKNIKTINLFPGMRCI